jgi:hypothetical protein
MQHGASTDQPATGAARLVHRPLRSPRSRQAFSVVAAQDDRLAEVRRELESRSLDRRKRRSARMALPDLTTNIDSSRTAPQAGSTQGGTQPSGKERVLLPRLFHSRRRARTIPRFCAEEPQERHAQRATACLHILRRSVRVFTETRLDIAFLFTSVLEFSIDFQGFLSLPGRDYERTRRAANAEAGRRL